MTSRRIDDEKSMRMPQIINEIPHISFALDSLKTLQLFTVCLHTIPRVYFGGGETLMAVSL